MAALLLELDLTAPVRQEGGLVFIDTVYDGEDLAEVGRLTGLGTDGVIEAHTGQVWTVAFAGFAPGFGYMVGENQVLEVPRRSSPRTAVPAGSVALAGNYSAVYPRKSPGGWQLIGRTGARMWDLDRAEPALASPGHRVQFRAVREVVTVAPEPQLRGGSRRWRRSGTSFRSADCFPRTAEPDPGSRPARPLRPGRLRRRCAGPGLAAPGQPAGGQRALGRRHRNRGRRAQGAGGRGPGPGRRRGAVGTDCRIAVGRDSAGDADDDGSGENQPRQRNVPMATPFALLDGEILTLGAPEAGFRSYLAVRGGAAPPGAGQPVHGHHVRHRPGAAGCRPGPRRRRRHRLRRRGQSRAPAGLPGPA